MYNLQLIFFQGMGFAECHLHIFVCILQEGFYYYVFLMPLTTCHFSHSFPEVLRNEY